jgi:ATP-binding cassette subfamily F protein 3
VAVAGKASPAPAARPGPAAASAPSPAAAREDDKQRKRREADERRERARVLGPLEKRVADLEERIATLEAAQAGRSAALADPAVYADEARRRTLLGEYAGDQEKLEELTGRWEAAAGELEAARAKLG